MTSLALSPISVAGLHKQPLLFRGQLNTPKFRNPHRLIRYIAQTILAAQLVLNDVENLLDCLLLRYIKKTSTGCFRHPHERFLAIRASDGEAISARVGEQDRVDQRVGAMSRLHA